MYNNPRKKLLRRWWSAALTMVVVFAGLATETVAREWAVGENNAPVEAELIDFNDRQVLLKMADDKMMTVAISDLARSDLEYLNHLVQLRQARIARQQLQQQQFQNLARFFDLWAVELIAPNGDRIEQAYWARSNQQAVQLALRDFPFARVGYTRKVRRSNNQAF